MPPSRTDEGLIAALTVHRTNAAIARRVTVTERAVEDDHRRVMAVLRYLAR